MLRYSESIGKLNKVKLDRFVWKGETERGEWFDIVERRNERMYMKYTDNLPTDWFKVHVYVYFKEFETEIKSSDCVVCLDAIPVIFLVNCGHTCICEDCKNKLEKDGKVKCPLCRKINNEIINR